MAKEINSSSILRGPQWGRGPNVAGVSDAGVTHLEEGLDLDEGDVLSVVYIPQMSYIGSYLFAFPATGLELQLRDSLEDEPTIFMEHVEKAEHGGVVTMSDVEDGDEIKRIGTQYGNTPRKLGPFGWAVKRWVFGPPPHDPSPLLPVPSNRPQGVKLQLKVKAAHTIHEDMDIIHHVVFFPVYDGGI